MTSPVFGTRTKLLYAAITLVLSFGILEGISWLAIRVVSPRLGEPIRRTQDIYRDQTERIERWLDADSSDLFVIFDANLGWRQRAGYRSALYTIGAQGVRGGTEYAPVPPAGIIRVDAFGDSFVFGTEVDDTSAWTAVIERAYPGLEVPNYGVGGYGLDQTYLAVVAHGDELDPQIVLVGYVPDEFRRAVNVYRRFLSTLEPPLVKPRFLLSDSGGLTLVPTPLNGESDYRRILQHPKDVLALGRLDDSYSPLIYQNPLYDYSATVRLVTALWIRASRRYLGPNRLYAGKYVNPSADAFRLQVALFEQAAASIRRQGAEPLFVFFPDRESLQRITAGGRPSYQPLVDTLRARGLQPVDVAEAFPVSSTSDIGSWFATAHYSPEGNRVVGAWLGQVLQERGKALVTSRSAPHSL